MKKYLILFGIFVLFLSSCKQVQIFSLTEEYFDYPQENSESNRSDYLLQEQAPLRIGFNDFPRALPIPECTEERKATYNASALGDYIQDYNQADLNETLSGYVTENFGFYKSVLQPELLPYLDSLKSLQKYQALNALALFIFESYQEFFGKSFYRWGGDITDRDQPQTAGSHSTSIKRYGMDCSGYGASAYELAVLLGVLDSTLNESAFSCFGFKNICENNPAISDGGGRLGSSNNYRMEVSDMYKVGTRIISIPAGGRPTDTQMALMQAGDIVLRSGHMGILVEIKGTLYFLESGGSTLSKNNLYQPYRAKEALENFAANRNVEIRRCLPKKETVTAVVAY